MVSRYTISFECGVIIVVFVVEHIWNCRALITISVFILFIYFCICVELKSHMTSSCCRALKNLEAPPERHTIMQLPCKISCKLMWMQCCKTRLLVEPDIWSKLWLVIFNRKIAQEICLPLCLFVSFNSFIINWNAMKLPSIMQFETLCFDVEWMHRPQFGRTLTHKHNQ